MTDPEPVPEHPAPVTDPALLGGAGPARAFELAGQTLSAMISRPWSVGDYVLAYGPAGLTLAALRGIGARLRLQLLAVLAAGLLSAALNDPVEPAGRAAILVAWPLGAALGLAVMDLVEPRLAAAIGRRWRGDS